MRNQLNYYVPSLAREQVTFRKLLKKGEPLIVTENMVEEFEVEKVAITNNI